MEYSGLNFHEIDQLLYEEFLLYRRDAYIYRLQQTEKGRKYLQNCFLYEKTEPDRDSLWKLKEKGVR